MSPVSDVREYDAPFTFDIADTGWSANRDVPGLFALVREAAPLGSVYFARVDEVISSPCTGGADGATGAGSPSASKPATTTAAIPNLRMEHPSVARA